MSSTGEASVADAGGGSKRGGAACLESVDNFLRTAHHLLVHVRELRHVGRLTVRELRRRRLVLQHAGGRTLMGKAKTTRGSWLASGSAGRAMHLLGPHPRQRIAAATSAAASTAATPPAAAAAATSAAASTHHAAAARGHSAAKTRRCSRALNSVRVAPGRETDSGLRYGCAVRALRHGQQQLAESDRTFRLFPLARGAGSLSRRDCHSPHGDGASSK